MGKKVHRDASAANSGEQDGAAPQQGLVDRGAQAWTAVGGAWCCLFCSFGWVNAIGVFQDYYEAHQLKDYSSSSIAWILSLEPFVLFAAGLFVGKLFDNYGPRWLLVTGTFLHVFGVMMISISSEYYQLLLSQGICSPLGCSFVFYSGVSSTATWFQERKALAYGVIASGASIGGIVFPAIIPRLSSALGFGWAIRICGFLILALLLVANGTVRSRIAPGPKPASLGEYLAPFSEVPFVLLTIASSLGFLAMFVPINYIILQAIANGVEPQLSNTLLTILNVGSLPGRILPGYVGDKVGRFNVMIVMCTMSAIVILALWLPGTLLAPGSAAVYVVFSLLYGFASGAFVSMVPALLAQISTDMSVIGLRQGVLFTFLAIASLCGSPIAGAILNAQDGAFWGLQTFSGAMVIGSVAFFTACRLVTAPSVTARA
ncbi:putative MFS monocarboxylate transporter [Xylariales sp. PMI_506]|nr:putative MFS monocarboxylate transporter [Xylariales sp. PMI_506]